VSNRGLPIAAELPSQNQETEEEMKTVTAILSLLVLSSIASAQNPDPSKWMCRNLADSGGFAYQGESIFGTQACRPVPQATPTAPVVVPVTPHQEAMMATVSSPAPVPVVSAAPQPAPGRATAGAAPSAVSSAVLENNLTEPGMYVSAAGDYTKILGQIVDFQRSGSKLASDLTLHLKTSKQNVQLLGAHAQTVTASSPEFYFVPAKQEADAGVNAGDLILVRLEEEKERRQFEIGAQGAWRESKGISLTHQVQLSRSEVRPGVYKITPAAGLNRGEYGLYLARGEGMAPYIYDFSVR
jgi:hypothetical protein